MLMAAGLEVPERVVIHGFLLMGEHKMSKSLGNVIDPFRVAKMYGPDALRFYYAGGELRADGDVSPEGFETRYTTELANEYGNLASRTLAMVGRYRDGVVPAGGRPPSSGRTSTGWRAVGERFDEVELTGALDEIWRRIKRLNRYVQDEQPWQLAKDEAEAERLDEVLYGLAEGLRVVSVLLHPFMPRSAERLLDALGREDLSLEPPASVPSAAAPSSASSASSSRAWSRGAGGLGAVIDTHCHLDACEPPDAELVERARAAGVGRLATVGTDGASIERALGAAQAPRRGVRDRRAPSPRGRRLRAGRLEEIERAAADPAPVRSARPG